MKSLFLVLALISSSMAWAGSVPTCDGSSECTKDMQEISNQFQQGNANFIQSDLAVYSGECFHLDYQYDPNEAHHGAFAFEKSADGNITTATGIFSFFWGANPYASFTAQELKDYLKAVSTPAPLKQVSDPVTLEFDSSDALITYWFRSNPEGDQLSVIGSYAQGLTRNYVFCRMNRHH